MSSSVTLCQRSINTEYIASQPGQLIEPRPVRRGHQSTFACAEMKAAVVQLAHEIFGPFSKFCQTHDPTSPHDDIGKSEQNTPTVKLPVEVLSVQLAGGVSLIVRKCPLAMPQIRTEKLTAQSLRIMCRAPVCAGGITLVARSSPSANEKLSYDPKATCWAPFCEACRRRPIPWKVQPSRSCLDACVIAVVMSRWQKPQHACAENFRIKKIHRYMQ